MELLSENRSEAVSKPSQFFSARVPQVIRALANADLNYILLIQSSCKIESMRTYILGIGQFIGNHNGMQYKHNGNLPQHDKIHYLSARFHCCGQGFRRKEVIRRHRLLHSHIFVIANVDDIVWCNIF